MVWNQNTRQSVFHNTVSPLDYKDYKEQNDVFLDLGEIVKWGFTLSGIGDAEPIFGFQVSSSFLTTIRVEPFLGRNIRPEEDQPGGNHVALVSYTFWQNRLGSDREAVNKTITLDGAPYQVIGVLPAGFRFMEDGDVWVPVQQNRQIGAFVRSVRLMSVVGRLKPSVSLEAAQSSLRTIASRLESQYPETNSGFTINCISLHDEITGSARLILFVLMGAVGVVLLIACANVGNLVLARAVDRQREVAVRRALGAGRTRLVRQFVAESVIVSMSGAAVGCLFAYAGIRYLVSLGVNIPRITEIRIDVPVLLFTVLVAMCTGMFFGLVPAFTASKTNLNDTLKAGGRTGMSKGRNHLRKGLLVSEVALALILLIASGLLVRSFIRLVNVDPGYETEKILYVGTALPPGKYPRPEQRLAAYQQLEDALKSISGVEGVGAVSRFPLSTVVGSGNITSFMNIEMHPKPAGERPEVDYRVASIGYFDTMRIPLLKGRQFDPRDSTAVIIINDVAAKRFWPGEDPIGQRVQFGTGANLPWVTIVGIVGNVRHLGLDVDPRPEIYRPYANNPLTGPQIAVRSTSDPKSVMDRVRSEIHRLEPEMPLRMFPVEQLAQLSTAQRRFSTTLLGLFALLAVTLAVVGVYGLMSYSVSQRTQEIGVRMALGAQSQEVVRMIVREGLMLTLAGIVIGTAGAFAITRKMTALLFGITSADPMTYVSVAITLLAVAFVACCIPALRASRVDPLVALRHE
jgi:predicted permease